MPRLVIDIVGDTRKLERAFSKAERDTRSFSQRMGRVARVGLFAGAATGIAGLGVTVRAGLRELADMQKVTAQTEAALKSTGNVAGVTGKQIEGLANSLQRLTGYDDEAIQAAENLILTFTNVRNVVGQGNDVFNQAALATLNISRRFDRDLSASAIQLGKALQDPIRGVTALRRSGIQLSSQQEKLVRRFVESGRVLEAQKIILREVERQVGGSAKAYGDTFPGQLDILRGSLENLAGDLMTTLNPELEKLTRQFNKWLEDPEHKQQIIDGWATGVRTLGDAFQFAADSVGALKSAWDRLPDFGKDKGLFDLINLPGKDKGLLELLGITGGGGGLTGKVGGGGDFDKLGRAIEKAAGGTAKPPGVIPRERETRGATAEQRNRWFDAMIGRALGRVEDVRLLKGQIGRLNEIANLIRERLAITKDITRRITLEDELADVIQRRRGIEDVIADREKASREAGKEARREVTRNRLERERERRRVEREREQERRRVKKERDQERRQREQDAREARVESRFGWAEFAIERAESTEATGDDLRALRRMENLIQEQIRAEGRTLELTRKLWRTRKEIRDLNKKEAGDQTKFRHMSTARMVDALGLDLTAAETARLRQGLAQLGPGRSLPHQGLQFSGAGARPAVGGGGVVITGPVTVNGVTDIREFERVITKRAKSRAHTRRGPGP